MNCIQSSFFDIYKIGPGPSSSHTIGPMKAAGLFLKHACEYPSPSPVEDLRIEIHFYGSLALTGRGHGTNNAALAGLLGEVPETCNTRRLSQFFSNPMDRYEVVLPFGIAVVTNETVFFHTGKHKYPYQNTMVFALIAGADNVLLEETYFSTGGGFVKQLGEEENSTLPVAIPYRYHSMDTFQKMLSKTNLSPVEALLKNEMALENTESELEVRSRLRKRIEVMTAAVERGLATEGLLPGPLGVVRRARGVFAGAENASEGARDILLMDAFALAASEENAACNLVVTAPTSGASGILPSLIYHQMHYRGVDVCRIEEGLMMACCIAFIARHNASISGAEVGCQGEVGVASAMGAALLATIYGCPIQVIESAAEIALEHHLGMSCDPVAGYVQVPCIERNAIGTVTAYNSFLLARTGVIHSCKVSFDEVLLAMYQTGRRMAPEFKETSLGGLAACSCCM